MFSIQYLIIIIKLHTDTVYMQRAVWVEYTGC